MKQNVRMRIAKPKLKPKPMTFEELVQTATLGIHSSLIEGGGNAMRSAVWKWLSSAIEWDRRKEK